MPGVNVEQSPLLVKNQPKKEQPDTLFEIINQDVFYTDSNGKRYLLLGVTAKELD